MAVISRVSALALAFAGVCAAAEKRDLKALDESYDYVVVGGGVSGLVVANRLTEDLNKTVLVIEYGEQATSQNTSVPGFAVTKDQSARTLAYPSTPQTHLANRSARLPLGAAVGGGSVINGMAYTRGSAEDYNSWEALGNEGWKWESLLPYFHKSTTFTPPQEEYVEKYGFEWTPKVYGHGPLQVGFASWQWPASKLEAQAWVSDLNTTYTRDGADGNNTGLIWTAQTVSGVTGERSSAGTAYYQPVSNRTNLHLLVRHYGAKIVFDGNSTTAAGIQINSRDSVNATRFIASRNIIMASGAINTPRLLQLSGIGPKDLLESLDIDTLVDAPGVGANFQDHPAMYLSFKYNNETDPSPSALQDPDFYAAAWEEYTANRTGVFTFGLAGRINFASLQDFNPDFESVARTVASPKQLDYLPASYANNSLLLAGYRKQLGVLQSQFLSPHAGVVEVATGGSGAVSLALQKPLSRGTVMIKSNDPDPSIEPLIDFNSGANPMDIKISISAIRKVREFMAAKSLTSLNVTEVVPGTQYETDEELEGLLRKSLYGPSFAHPAGTAAMLPKELGGVVGTDLQVYGTQGLWVVDASIIPILPAAHTQATVYAVAELAADLIKQYAARA
ncbi:hypothetical protein Q7P35_004554 [Cladosporium inversicolor]